MTEPADKATNPLFRPHGSLGLFCAMNLIVYLDRGAIASNGVNGSFDNDPATDRGIQGDFKLGPVEDGFLPAAFLVGLLVASPIFAEASKHHNALRIIGVGLALWTVAIAGCAVSFGFWSIMLCRMLVGVGEASFVAIAAPFIDDNAPPARKTLWLATFYLCIPVGYALGYVFGGVIHFVLDCPGDWRWAFALEAIAMIPFVLLCAFVPRPIDLKGKSAHPIPMRAMSEFIEDLKVILRHPVYDMTIAGFTVYTAVLGAYSYWGPKAGREVFHLESSTADILFGAVTVITGVIGTLGGGMVLDKIGSSMKNALTMCSIATLLGCIFLIVAYGFTKSLAWFIVFFSAGELALFWIQAPGNAVTMWSIPAASRPLGMSLLIIVIHVFGDVPSPPIVGAMYQAIQNWRITLSVFTLLLVVSALFFGISMHLSKSAKDYRLLNTQDSAPSSAVYSAVETTDDTTERGDAEA